LVKDILDCTKMDENKLNIEAYPFSLYKVIKDSFKSVILEARKKHVELVNIVNKNIPPLLIGDPCRVKQILINLLSNAIKFSDSGTVEVSSYWELLEYNDQYLVTVKVKDNGPGISEEEKELLFHPFSQTSCGKKHGGSGLGLFISKRLAQRMGGDMWFDSVKGVGSNFYFSFVTTIAQPDAKVDDVVGSETVTLATTTCLENKSSLDEPLVTLQNKTLQKIVNLRYLIAEDNVVNKFLVRKLLKRLGCVHVKAVDNGLQTFEEAKLHRYDVIFMDINMPVMNGIEATEKIRKEIPLEDQPNAIIALTADLNLETRENCILAGMQDLLYKPIHTESLRELLIKIANEQTTNVSCVGTCGLTL